MIRLPLVLIFSAVLFSAGVYGVLARRNAVMVLMAIELLLNAVNVNLIAFAAQLQDVTGQVFALFVIAVAAAEVGIGLGSLILRAWPLDTTPAAPSAPGGSDVLGSALFNTYVLPFEAVSFLLLAALIGAIVLARRDEGT